MKSNYECRKEQRGKAIKALQSAFDSIYLLSQCLRSLSEEELSSYVAFQGLLLEVINRLSENRKRDALENDDWSYIFTVVSREEVVGTFPTQYEVVFRFWFDIVGKSLEFRTIVTSLIEITDQMLESMYSESALTRARSSVKG